MHGKLTLGWLVGLFALTATLLAWQYFGMTRTHVVNAHGSHNFWAIDDRTAGGDSVGTVAKAADGVVLHCVVGAKNPWPYCGFSTRFGEGIDGVDLADFHDVVLDIRTSGTVPMPVRLYLLNYNPAYSTAGDDDSLKINEIQYTPDNRSAKAIPLNNLHTSAWWLQERRIDPVYAGSDLSDVIALQVFTGEGVKPGTYTITVRSITLRGKWLTRAGALWIVLSLWLVSALVYFVATLWRYRRDLRAMRSEKRRLEDINAAFRSERDELETLATHDELTGLPNRMALRNHLYQVVPPVQRGEAILSLVFIDLDHFKAINDQHGHLCGDEILRQFAALLRTSVRAGDFGCRWGGEEFLLVCAGTPLAAACAVAEKLRAQVARQHWANALPLTCSFGVAQMQAGESTTSLIHRADAALYAAKQGGRNRVCPAPGVPADTASAA